MLTRMLGAAIAAAAITFALFFLMQFLITMEQGDLKAGARLGAIDFVRLKRNSELEVKKRELPNKTQPNKQPKMPTLDMKADPSNAGAPTVNIAPPSIDQNLNMRGGLHLGAPSSDSTQAPLIRVNPLYPANARRRRVEGWVEVKFTINEMGAVEDPEIMRSEPPGVFDRAAIRAILKWKYKPQVIDGKGIKTPGQKVRLTFKLEDE